ncbi:MAG: peroxiredoxin family protein [Planctomycetota bacterium]|jgi:tetratricopeptide (TPR) repeat protein
MKFVSILAGALALAITAGASAQRKKLEAGDTAPGFDVEAWVGGEEQKIEEGSVYVVLFWEPQSARRMTGDTTRVFSHLGELAKYHIPDKLLVMAIGSAEEELQRFARSQRQGLGFPLGADRRDSTKRAWYDAANAERLPCVFIVDRKGRIAYIGDPDEDFDRILDRVLRGRYDARLEYQAVPQLRAARNARKVRNWRLAMKHFQDVIDLDPKIFAEVAVELFDMFLVYMEDSDRAYSYVDTLRAGPFQDDAGALRMLAEKIASDPKIEQKNRDVDMALGLAEAAQQVAGASDPEALATRAFVHYHRGEFDEAVEYQRRAYFVALPIRKEQYRRTLVTYQEAHQRASLSQPSN